MIVLGIETSCDETSVGIVKDGKELLACVTASSMEIHAKYGGVVPEIAAREQIQAINPVIEEALIQYGQSIGLDEVQGNNENRANRIDNTKNETRKQMTQQFAESGSSKAGFARLNKATAGRLWEEIDAIAVTYGAGLGGSLLIGVLTARTLAIVHNKPLYAINHVEGHVYANFLTNTKLNGYKLPKKQPQFPLLALIVSGGHTQLALFKDHFDYKLLGQTHDDAIGEAFDKVAKIIGLPYPGGPSIAKAAHNGNPSAFTLPKANVKTISPGLAELRTKIKNSRGIYSDEVQGNNENRANRIDNTKNETRKQMTQQFAENSQVDGFAVKSTVVNTSGYDFSFSGLKTAVLRATQELVGVNHDFPSYKLAERLSGRQKADIAASFQHTAIETAVDKTLTAYEEFQPKSVVIAGGVAASQELRRQLSDRLPCAIDYTDPKLCTDNGAMIATLGCFKARHTQSTADPYSLDTSPSLSM